MAARRNCLGRVRFGDIGKDYRRRAAGGAYAGPAEIMDMVAPLGPVYQAGTLSGNPLAMAAGMTTLKRLQEKKAEIYPQLEALSGKLVDGVAATAKDAKVPLTLNRAG